MSFSALVVGAGPAGLMAAETLAKGGASVTVADAAASPLRKFLLAGRGGLNLTHAEPFETLLTRYGAARERLAPALTAFPPAALREWAAELGEPTFVGSSGRVFPQSFKATKLARAWLKRLGEMGVAYLPRRRFVGLGDGIVFEGEIRRADVVVLALGGASWPRLGGDGGWVSALAGAGVEVAPLAP
ncbi:MAG: NAD(P)/FAD-dependent oxidoreductase, partial [Pseudomonadota bacterium]|nr:NAD(P)/FAD-dependent oxidoreductase [Pseudomonadota bacterium]